MPVLAAVTAIVLIVLGALAIDKHSLFTGLLMIGVGIGLMIYAANRGVGGN